MYNLYQGCTTGGSRAGSGPERVISGPRSRLKNTRTSPE